MKNKMIPIRMSQEMVANLDKRKNELKIRDRSALIREAIELYFKSDQPQLTREMVDEFNSWRKEFHGVGSNLNQIAYKMNANHPLSTDQIVDTLEELQEQFDTLATNVLGLREALDI